MRTTVRPSTLAFAWTRWFVVVAALVGTVFVFVTPALEGTDEPAHFSRVAMIDAGRIIPPPTASENPDAGADACITAYVYRHRAARFAGEPVSWTEQFRNPPCTTPGWSLAATAHTADVYSPVPYLPALVGFRIGRAVAGAAGSLYGARLVQLAAFVALMAFAIHRAAWGKALLFTIGLLPVVIQGAANVSADPITLALACCAVAITLAAVDRARTGTPVTAGTWWAFTAVGVGLALSKSAYVPFVLLVLAVPTAAFGSLRRRAAIGAGTLATAGLFAGLWNIGVVAQMRIDGVNHSDSRLAAAWIRRHPIGFLEGILRGWANPLERHAVLGGLFTPVRRWAHNFPLPIWTGLLWLAVVRLLDPIPARFSAVADRIVRTDRVGVADGPVLARRDRVVAGLVALGVGIASFLLIEYGLAIAANPPAAHEVIWVQGRYLLPLLPLTLFGVAGVHRELPRRWLIAIPMVSIVVSVLWIWWASDAVWGWI